MKRPEQEPKPAVKVAAEPAVVPAPVPFFAKFLEVVPRVNSGLRAGRRG